MKSFCHGLVACLLLTQCRSRPPQNADLKFTETYPYRKYYQSESEAGPKLLSVYSNPLNDDLFKIYEKEHTDLKARLPQDPARRQEKLRLTHELFKQRNAQVLRSLQQARGLAPSPHRHRYNEDFIARVRHEIETHPVAGPLAYGRFASDAQVGFCFGRATLAHLLLSRQGVPQNDMLKIFALGRIRYQEMLWDFHMATVVRGYDDKKKKEVWWVVDTLLERPLQVDEWMQKVSAFSLYNSLSDVRFYTTEVKKFQPSFGEYRSENLEHPAYQGFFNELMRH